MPEERGHSEAHRPSDQQQQAERSGACCCCLRGSKRSGQPRGDGSASGVSMKNGTKRAGGRNRRARAKRGKCGCAGLRAKRQPISQVSEANAARPQGGREPKRGRGRGPDRETRAGLFYRESEAKRTGACARDTDEATPAKLTTAERASGNEPSARKGRIKPNTN